jgi:hypothetical protein
VVELSATNPEIEGSDSMRKKVRKRATLDCINLPVGPRTKNFPNCLVNISS